MRINIHRSYVCEWTWSVFSNFSEHWLGNIFLKQKMFCLKNKIFLNKLFRIQILEANIFFFILFLFQLPFIFHIDNDVAKNISCQSNIVCNNYSQLWAYPSSTSLIGSKSWEDGDRFLLVVFQPKAIIVWFAFNPSM